MAYFVKGNPAIPKPTSLLGASNKAMSEAQKMRMVEKQQRQRVLLEAAKMKMSQEMALRKEQLAAMRYQATEQRRAEERLDSQQLSFDREVRRIQGNANLEPYAQEFFPEVIAGQKAAANNFRGSIESATAMIDNIMGYVQKYSKDKDSAAKLADLNGMDALKIKSANAALENNFQRIDEETLADKQTQANFLYQGGFANNMNLEGAGDLSGIPTIKGNEISGFDEQGLPQYSDELIDVSKSKFYHDQGNTGMMVTPMKEYFGRTFIEIGSDVRTDLQREAGSAGQWSEDDARKYVGGLLRLPFGEKAREWRMRSLLGNISDPSANEGSDGIYYKFADKPELRDRLMKMVVDYDIADQNGLKPLYIEYKPDIDAAIQLAEDKIVPASDFDNPQRPLRTTTPRRVSPLQQTITSRQPIFEPESNETVIGSLYSPRYLETNTQRVSVSNAKKQAEWDAEKEEGSAKILAEMQAKYPTAPGVALDNANKAIAKKYKDSDRPDDEVLVPIKRLAFFPDGRSEDGTSSLYIVNDSNEFFPISTTDGTTWGAIATQIEAKSNGRVTINDLLDDMADKRDGQAFDFTDEQIRALRPEPTEPDAATQPTAPASTFPSYPEWKKNNPNKTADDWRAEKAAAQ